MLFPHTKKDEYILKLCLFTVNAKGFDWPPYGIWVLKAFIDKYSGLNDFDIEVSILSLPESSTEREIVEALRNENAEIIGLSHYIWNDNIFMSIIPTLKTKLIKKPRIVMGGPHVTFSNKKLTSFVNEFLVDALIVGEGEEPLLYLLKCWLMDAPINVFPGLYVHKQNKGASEISLNINKEPKNIDYLPNPYRELPQLLELSKNKGVIQYETSRGCPFSCTFCDQGHKVYKNLTLERVKSDLQFFADNDIKYISFLDGTFNLNPKRTVVLLNLLIELKDDWQFHAEIKPENLSSVEINLMKQANFKSVELGIQSIHSNTLKLIKRRNKWEKLERNTRELLQTGLEVNVNTIIGLPEENLQDWLDSLDYCFMLGDVRILSNLLKILPNTVMAEQIGEFGFNVNEEMYNSITNTKHFSKDEIREALIINKLVNLFWNNTNTPRVIRNLVEKYFDYKFSRFLKFLYKTVLNNPKLLSGECYFENTINFIISDLETGDNQLATFN